MVSAVFDNAMINMAQGLINIKHDTASTLCVLGQNKAPVKATWATYNDIKYSSGNFEIAAITPGYALGGSAIGVSQAPTLTAASPPYIAIKATPTVFTVSGGNTLISYYAIIQNLINTGTPTSVSATNPLLCYINFGGAQSVYNGTLTLTWNSTYGICTFTIASAA